MKKLNKNVLFALIVVLSLIPPVASASVGEGGQNNSDIRQDELISRIKVVAPLRELGRLVNKIKHSIYYLANFKMFFSVSDIRLLSYKNRIVEIAGHNSYWDIIEEHKAAYGTGSKELFEISQTVEKLKCVQQEINKRGKSFLVVSGYSGWQEVYGDKISPYYRYFENFYQDDADKMRTMFNDFLKKADINYFNSHLFLENVAKTTALDTVSFYDSHWNRYGAGLVMIETLTYLKTVYKTNWELPQIKSIEISSTPSFDEVMGLKLVRLFQPLENSFMQKERNFPYIVYEIPMKENGTKVALLGDSFTWQYETQLKTSRFTDAKNISLYAHREEDIRADIDKIIDTNDVIIVIYIESNFYGQTFKNIVDVFYNHLQ
ncbi:MAG: hypothetical protein LBB93_04685 [Elusimicrobiota bacterium]|nr:hypothetical protein [Elusimicrobiota bacterium]